jgi:hypothetical protein
MIYCVLFQVRLLLRLVNAKTTTGFQKCNELHLTRKVIRIRMIGQSPFRTHLATIQTSHEWDEYKYH